MTATCTGTCCCRCCVVGVTGQWVWAAARNEEWRISWASKLQLTLGSMCACPTVLQGVLCGMMSGAFGQFFASPTDLIKVAGAPLGACCHSAELFPVAIVLPTPDAVVMSAAIRVARFPQVQLQLDGKLIAAGKPPRYSGTIDAFRTVAREASAWSCGPHISLSHALA